MARLLIKLKDFCLNLLFPPVCLVCRRKIKKILSQSAALRANGHGSPTAVGESERAAPVSELAGRANGSLEKKFSFICLSCSQKIQINSNIDKKTGLAAAVSYSDEVPRQLIATLKYQKIKTAAVPLAEILYTYIVSLREMPHRDKNFLIIPVPLHRHRERERGFNQSDLIAEELSRKTGLPVFKNILKRIRNTPSQVELKEKKKREMNVCDCFKVENSDFLVGKNVIVLDDVSTTGATMREAMKIVKKSGAAKVLGLVIAKV